MNHLGTKVLRTDRLELRRFTLNDSDAMFKNWASDDEVTKYLSWPTYKKADDTLEIINYWISQYDKIDYYHWAIVLKGNGDEPIGSIGVVSNNYDISMAHIGYCIGQKYWRMGIMSEALSAIIKYLFEEVGINRIESMHNVCNPNSGKVMVRNGMKYEGTTRESYRDNQGICDYSLYAILASDYKK